MIWKDIPGFSGYEVSEHGQVRNGARHLKAELTHGNGRKRFGLSRDGRVFRFKAAQLVALAFIGPMPFAEAEVCHNDNFEHNNHYSNLRWDSSMSNAADMQACRAERMDWRSDHHSRQLSAAATAFLGAADRENAITRARQP